MTAIQRDGKYNYERVEDLILDVLGKPSPPRTIGNLIQYMRTHFEIPEKILLQAIRNIRDKELVTVNVQSKVQNNKSEIVASGSRWLYANIAGKEFLFTISFAILSAFTTLILPALIPGGIPFLQITLGFLVVIYLPGFALVSAIYPEWFATFKIERMILSFVFSMAIVPILLVGLNFLPEGISQRMTTLSILCFIVIMSIIAGVRKYRLQNLSLEKKTSTKSQ